MRFMGCRSELPDYVLERRALCTHAWYCPSALPPDLLILRFSWQILRGHPAGYFLFLQLYIGRTQKALGEHRRWTKY